jgi:hypothetical protein
MLEAVAVCPGKVCAAMCGQNAKLTVTVERIDGGKLRCEGQNLARKNDHRVSPRRAGALRAPAPGGVVQTPRRHPRFGEDDFEAPPDGVGTPRSREDDLGRSRRGGRHPRFREDDFEAPPDEVVGTPPSRADDFEAAPDEGAIPLSFYCPAERDAIVVLLPASPDLGEVISRPSRRSGSAPRMSVRCFRGPPDEGGRCERIDGGKPRARSTWEGCPFGSPHLGEGDFGASDGEGGFGALPTERWFRGPPAESVVWGPSRRRGRCERINGSKPREVDLGRCRSGRPISGPSRRSDQKGAASEPQRLAQNRPQPRTFAGR